MTKDEKAARERLGEQFTEIPRKAGTAKMRHPKRGGWKGPKGGN